MATAVHSTTLPGSPILHLLAQASRADIEATIEALITRLDELDPDPDLEPEVDSCGAHDDIGTSSAVSRLLGDDGRPGEGDDAEEDNEDMCPAGDHGGRLSPPTYRPPVRILARPDQPQGNGQWVMVTRTGEVVTC